MTYNKNKNKKTNIFEIGTQVIWDISKIDLFIMEFANGFDINLGYHIRK